MNVRIAQVETPRDIAEVRELFREYAACLQVDVCFQGFDAELAGLPGAYASPRGRLLLARVGNEAAGCVALRPLGEADCEMKRLFIRPNFRGRGLGGLLARKMIDEARAAGFATMRLDTLPFMQAALKLYENLGFSRCAPYYPPPLAETIFLELRLRAAGSPANTQVERAGRKLF